MVLKTIMGQNMDERSSVSPNLGSFTPALYEQIVANKTSLYTFYAPAAMALIMARVKDESLFDAVLKLSLRIGFLFQAQDDFLDCFGIPAVTGKVGMDIQDGKCSWLIVAALRKSSPSQRNILEGNFGLKCDNAVNRVKQVYRELELESDFREFERKSYKEIMQMIVDLPPRLPKNTYFDILDSLYQREK